MTDKEIDEKIRVLKDKIWNLQLEKKRKIAIKGCENTKL